MSVNIQISDENWKKISNLKTKYKQSSHNKIISALLKIISKLKINIELEQILNV